MKSFKEISLGVLIVFIILFVLEVTFEFNEVNFGCPPQDQ